MMYIHFLTTYVSVLFISATLFASMSFAQNYLAPSSRIKPKKTISLPAVTEAKTTTPPPDTSKVDPTQPSTSGSATTPPTTAATVPVAPAATTTSLNTNSADLREWQNLMRTRTNSSSACGDYPTLGASGTKTPASLDIDEQLTRIEKWPGVPSVTTKAYRFILRHSSPPVTMDGDQLLKEIQELPNCDFYIVMQTALSLADRLKEQNVPMDKKQQIAKAARQFLEKISNDPLDLRKSQTSVDLLAKITDSHLDTQLNKKERMVRSLSTRHGSSGRDPASPFSQPLRDYWQNVHDAEAIRMEVARILFFP